MISLWSVKGGSGTSVVSALLGIACAQLESTVLVDTDGDLPSIFGVQPAASGFSEWMMAGDGVTGDALLRLATSISSTLRLVAAGSAKVERPRANASFDSHDGITLFDAGTIRDETAVAASLVKASETSLLVIRPCYLAARRATETSLRVDGLIVIEEQGRALRSHDMVDVIGVPVVATLPWDISIARAIDAGRLANRVPKAAKPIERLAASLAARVG